MNRYSDSTWEGDGIYLDNWPNTCRCVRRATAREDVAICRVSVLDVDYSPGCQYRSREVLWISSRENRFASIRQMTMRGSWWTSLVWLTNDSDAVHSRWFEQLSLLMMCLISSHRDYSTTCPSWYMSISCWRTWANWCRAFLPGEDVCNRKTALQMRTRPIAVAVADVEEERCSNDTDDAYELLQHDRVI